MVLLRRLDIVAQLDRIACPTLICTGSLDPITPVEASRETADVLAPGRARLEVLEGAGHFPWGDVPDRYWPMLTRFVAAPHGSRGVAIA